MKVLGIDPGTAACGYGIVHQSEGRLRATVHGCWTTAAGTRQDVRLKTIFDGVGALIAAEGGADDLQRDGSTWEVTSAPEHLSAVREAVQGAGFTVENAELALIPKTTIEVDDENQAKKVLSLIDALEENDDVQEVYANFDIPERVLEEAMS